MINLEEHTIEVEGKKYIPLDIAQAAITENIASVQLDKVVDLVKKASNDLNSALDD